jgi:hypothetical protein
MPQVLDFATRVAQRQDQLTAVFCVVPPHPLPSSPFLTPRKSWIGRAQAWYVKCEGAGVVQ